MSGLLCRRCDVYVGYGALGVADPPDELPQEQWNHVCWVCRRTEQEIEVDQLKVNPMNTRNVIIETTFVFPGQQSPVIFQAHNVPIEDIGDWWEHGVASWTDAGGATFMVPFANVYRITIAAPPHQSGTPDQTPV